ncbi:HaeII family restriction endonuclease [Sulfurimonas sp. HSL-1716]|uniref:HaeII family restriction endonuclease n=1 Tax=Hydrocurvibacter sulfurireducens TaxID=3131937 RepID=UPI0031F8A960
MEFEEAKKLLDNVIKKGRVHFYKPIQVAEILYRDRIEKDINLAELETYRAISKKWRDKICEQFVGRVSTSSSKYQDDIFNQTAVPPEALVALGIVNRRENGSVESYIYNKFSERFNQLSDALNYCYTNKKDTFDLSAFLDIFWNEPGLRRSIDKIYEIVVYALFSSLIDALEVSVEISMNPDKQDLLNEFADFAKNVIQLSSAASSIKLKARINRVGVTNAADRGLDMWANFGLAIQIKHLSLTEELASNIVSSVSADRIVIVCKDAEEKIIISLLTQIGWKSRIQSVITESQLLNWYEKALRGKFSSSIGNNLHKKIMDEIIIEFPTTDNEEFSKFLKSRSYQ